jgi:hypothetical protein
MDHGALGTLIIGLDHVRRENESTDRTRDLAAHRRNRSFSRSLASWLRRLADAVDPAAKRIDLGLET